LKIITTETFCCGDTLNSSSAYSGILLQDTMLEKDYFGLPQNKNTDGNVGQNYNINSKDLTTVSVYT
jgi:hypothetical protein